MSIESCVEYGGQCVYTPPTYSGMCCCSFPSPPTPPPGGYNVVFANVNIFTNNVPTNVVNQVQWQINVSPSNCGTSQTGYGNQQGIAINIDGCGEATLTIQPISTPSGVSCTPLTASATVQANQTAVLALYCTPATPTVTGPSWSIVVNVNDPYNAGYIITDNYSSNDVLQAARSLSNITFATYPSSVSSVTLNASIQFNPPNMQCTITPSTITVNAPSGGTGSVTQNFTVTCSGAGAPSPTTTPTTVTATTPSLAPTARTLLTSPITLIALGVAAGVGIGLIIYGISRRRK